MKKIIILILLVLNPWLIFAYSSDDIVNLSFTNIDIMTNVYNVPVWKDLLIKEVKISSDSTHILISNDGINILSNLSSAFSYDTNILIKDNLFIEQDPNTNNIDYSFYAILVNENDNIENVVNNSDNGFNKNIFTYKWLQEIYLYEFVILLIIYIIVFFEKILGGKNTFMRK